MATAQPMSGTQRRRRPWREGIVVGLSLPVFVWAASRPPLAQDPSYHEFADQRWLYGLPHFWNVVSNLPFAVIGVLGCWWAIRAGRTSSGLAPGERLAYFVFFLGECLTCFGSGYYHGDPTNATLVWDRLALSLMLTSILAIVIAEFVNDRFGRLLLAPMVVVGLFSVLYWAWSESRGEGDLRLYLLVQFYPMLAIPVILLLFPSRYTRAGAFWMVLVLYGLAKLAEVYDRPILEWTGFWSGHTVKHLVAAGASLIVLDNLRRRALRLEDAGTAMPSYHTADVQEIRR